MAVTKRIEQQIEILLNGIIQVRDTIIIEEDDIELTRTFHRKVIDVDDFIGNESDRVKSVAFTVWTQEVINKRAAIRGRKPRKLIIKDKSKSRKTR